MRNRIITAILSLFLLAGTGCISSEVKAKLSKNAAELDGYVKRMENAETTSEEDQNMIRAMRIWTWSMNHAANGTKLPPDVELILEGSR